MSAIPTDEPAQDPPPSIEPQQLQQLQQQQLQQQQQLADVQSPPTTDQTRKRTYSIFSSPPRGLISLLTTTAKAPSVRRACVACHTGKTRCSEVLPCQVRCLLSPSRPRPLVSPDLTELSQTRLGQHLCLSRS
jgi:hypothetical protein